MKIRAHLIKGVYKMKLFKKQMSVLEVGKKTIEKYYQKPDFGHIVILGWHPSWSINWSWTFGLVAPKNVKQLINMFYFKRQKQLYPK